MKVVSFRGFLDRGPLVPPGKSETYSLPYVRRDSLGALDDCSFMASQDFSKRPQGWDWDKYRQNLSVGLKLVVIEGQGVADAQGPAPVQTQEQPDER
jgi:hypothetical protein